MRNLLLFCLFFIIVSCNEDNAVAIKRDILTVDSIKEADVSFFHISDTHGSSISIIPMVDMLNESGCDFGIITGDVLIDNYMKLRIRNSNKPIFIIPGNHDAYDLPNGQTTFRRQVLDYLQGINHVHFGSEVANYYYVDIIKNGRTTRVIGLDQYEIDVVGKAYTYEVVMSQHQINWFVDLLQNSYDVDGIVILTHCGFGYSTIGRRDTGNRNSFISTLAYDYNSYLFYGNGYPLMIPDIMNAYLTGVNLVNKEYPSGYDGVDLTVNTSFVGQHHNFVGYFGGHLHWDVCEYLRDYPMQLIVLMCYSGLGTGKYMEVDYNDIIKSNSGEDSYNINYNVIDYQKKSINIYRLGARKLCTGGTRDSIKFEINQ